MKNKNTMIIFLSFVIITLLCGLYYVIFIYDNTPINDIEGSCDIDKPCNEEITYIKEEEIIKTFDDNYLILPLIRIEQEEIENINKEIESRFNYYKDQFNKDNKKYKTDYLYTKDEDKNILSLMIIFCGDDENHTYLCECLTYNIDLSNNKPIDNYTLLEKYDIKDKDLIDKKLYINKDLKVTVANIDNN